MYAIRSYYGLLLVTLEVTPEYGVMLIETNTWTQFFQGESADALMKSLPAVLQRKRWFGGKSRQIKETRIADRIPLSCDGIEAMLLLVLVIYADETTETYQVP